MQEKRRHVAAVQKRAIRLLVELHRRRGLMTPPLNLYRFMRKRRGRDRGKTCLSRDIFRTPVKGRARRLEKVQTGTLTSRRGRVSAGSSARVL